MKWTVKGSPGLPYTCPAVAETISDGWIDIKAFDMLIVYVASKRLLEWLITHQTNVMMNNFYHIFVAKIP